MTDYNPKDSYEKMIELMMHVNRNYGWSYPDGSFYEQEVKESIENNMVNSYAKDMFIKIRQLAQEAEKLENYLNDN